MPETCENRLVVVKSCVYYTRRTREICQILPYAVDFKAPDGLWNPLGEKITLSKCSFSMEFGISEYFK